MNHGRRQQKRQTAGNMIGNFLKGGGGNGGRKKTSTAQPRPQILIPPKGIGPVHDINANDVLCGRGGRINAHTGNVQFREIVQFRKKDYLAKTTKKLEKAHIAAEVVQQIRTMEPNGRFLKEEKDGAWYDIGDQKAIKKVGQALREDAIEVRQEIGPDEEGEGGPSAVKSAKSPSSAQAVAQVETFETLASQDIAPPPAYQSMPPPPSHFGHGGGHVPHLSSLLPGMPAGTQVSSAAAAVMQEKEEDDNFDEAFGKTFVHPPLGVETHREASQISGLSGPTSDVMSGISFVSEKSVQPLRTSHNHYYPPPRSSMQSSFTPSDLTGTRNFLTNSTNLGSSLGRSNSLSEVNAPDNMSVTENSLTGGGLRESANQYMAGSVNGMASITGSNLSSEQYRERGGYRPPRHTGQSYRQPYTQYAAAPIVSSDLASVTSMSIGESILSGLSLSESLNALDLADPSRL